MGCGGGGGGGEGESPHYAGAHIYRGVSSHFYIIYIRVRVNGKRTCTL